MTTLNALWIVTTARETRGASSPQVQDSARSPSCTWAAQPRKWGAQAAGDRGASGRLAVIGYRCSTSLTRAAIRVIGEAALH